MNKTKGHAQTPQLTKKAKKKPCFLVFFFIFYQNESKGFYIVCCWNIRTAGLFSAWLRFDFFCVFPFFLLLFFSLGWPDTASDIYAKQIADLSKSYRCVLVESPWNEFTRERVLGPSFLDLYKGFDAVVESHRRADEKIILVAHDWGTMLALDYERKYGKQRVEKLVILDVFPEPSQKSRRPSLLLILLVLVYQSWLIVALLLHNYLPLVGQQLGNFMTYLCAYVFGAPCARNARKLSAVQNFYYLRFWQGFFGGEIKNLFPAHARENGGIRAPEVPLLFVHGSKKPVRGKKG
jgi:pimeloyl-ACP methyl ester carboxylesterase